MQFENGGLVLQVWAALLDNMPMTAMIRNLGKMSAIDLLKPLSSHSALVCSCLQDSIQLSKVLVSIIPSFVYISV